MAENQSAVNVEEIVEQIRADIADKYTEEDLREFDDIAIDEALKAAQPHYDKGEIQASGVMIGTSPFMEYYRDFPGGKLAVFIKRVARKLVRGTVQPIAEQQTAFNLNVIDATDKLSWMCRQQQAEMETLKKHHTAEIEALKKEHYEEMESLKKKVSDFEKILERY